MRVWVETKVGWVAGDVGYGRIKQAYVGASCQRVPCRPMTMRLTCAVPHADPCAMLILVLRGPRACTGRLPGRGAAAHAGHRAWVAGESGGMWILLDVGERITFSNIHLESGSDLLSRAVSSQVPSACGGLTSVFGMGTGGTLQP